MAIIEKKVRIKKKNGSDTIISYPQTVDDNVLVDGKTKKLSEKLTEYVPSRWNNGKLEVLNGETWGEAGLKGDSGNAPFSLTAATSTAPLGARVGDKVINTGVAMYTIGSLSMAVGAVGNITSLSPFTVTAAGNIRGPQGAEGSSGDPTVFLSSQPNFVEKTVTTAAFSGNLITTVVLGTGWTGTPPTITRTAGNGSSPAIWSHFPVSIVKDELYEVNFSMERTATTDNINLYFSSDTTSYTGQNISGTNIPNTSSEKFLVQADNNYSYLSIRVYNSNWAGFVTITSLKRLITTNSSTFSIKNVPFLNKNTNNLFGDGGKGLGTGADNTAFGVRALQTITTGSSNIAVGTNSLRNNYSGSDNIAVGVRSQSGNVAGSGNVSMGTSTLAYVRRGTANTAIGHTASNSLYEGSFNTAIGYSAIRVNNYGQYNTGVGVNSLGYLSSGDNNVAIGNVAGLYLAQEPTYMTTASKSIFIGDNSKSSATNAQTNQIVIGAGAIGGGSNTITLGNSDITQLRCQVTAITALSDSRVKESVELANLDMCLNDVKRLPIYRYKYKDFTGTHLDKNVTGFMADDVEKVFPKAVSKSDRYFPVLDENGSQVYEEITETDEDGNEITRQVEKMFLMEQVKDITMSESIPTLWGAVQKLIEIVEKQQAAINRLIAKSGGEE